MVRILKSWLCPERFPNHEDAAAAVLHKEEGAGNPMRTLRSVGSPRFAAHSNPHAKSLCVPLFLCGISGPALFLRDSLCSPVTNVTHNGEE